VNELTEEVPEALDGERLDRTVALLASVSRNRAGAAIDSGAVTVNDEPTCSRSRRVRVGEEVSIEWPLDDPGLGPEPDSALLVPVVYADRSVVVVDKPAGLVVHSGPGHESGTMVNGLLAMFPDIRGVGSTVRPGIVHRLDRGTSGLLVVARTQNSYDHLIRQLADRSVKREYLALAWGEFEGFEGVVDAPIGRSPNNRIRMAVVSSGRPSRTRYKIEQFWDSRGVSMVSLVLESGRTHQIRVHLSAIGHPVVGDSAYSGNQSDLGLGRPFLHASRLTFENPENGERMSFESSLPPELQTVLSELDESDV
jgi:23S rRNA pseudouridine1911/1915/1917 synthase